jgi:hypothetical protein
MAEIAFKEWAVVDQALGEGRQTILIRKGGVHERHGRFEIEHHEFFIYPTRLHQIAESLKPQDRFRLVSVADLPGQVAIRHLVRVEGVFRAKEESAGRWADFHIYSPELIASRFAYKPDRPLYVLLVRVFRLGHPARIIETPTYAGCRSWVNLTESIQAVPAAPVLADAEFAEITRRIRAAFDYAA